MKKEEVKIGGIYQLTSSSMWARDYRAVGVKVRVVSMDLKLGEESVDVEYLEGPLKGEYKTGYSFSSLEPVPVLTTKQLVQKLVSKC